jgi:hypothetical protein
MYLRLGTPGEAHLPNLLSNILVIMKIGRAVRDHGDAGANQAMASVRFKGQKGNHGKLDTNFICAAPSEHL